MNMRSIREPGSALKRAFVTLESGINDVLDEALSQPSFDLAEAGLESDSEPAATDFADLMASYLAGEEPAAPSEAIVRITAHAQHRLAEFTSFDESRSAVQKNLDQIGEALAGVIASHHLSRDFLHDCYADIYRANEMEVQNAVLSSETRRQAKRLEKLDKQRLRYEALVEMQKRRERKLTQEISALREELNEVKLDGVEARNLLGRTESQQGELHGALAAKTGLSERLMRENETLREKTASLALELEKAVKKQAKIQRAHDDLSAVHASESARYVEMTAQLASADKEAANIQRLHDGLAARLGETEDQLRALELEMSEREKRYQTENYGIKGESQALAARLQATTAEHLDAVSEVAALKARLSNSDSEKHVAEEKYAALCVEVETGGKQAGTAPAGSSDQTLIDMHKEETVALRAEIALLTEKLEGLRPAEKPQKAAKQRARVKPAFPETFGRKPLRLRPDMTKAVHAGM